MECSGSTCTGKGGELFPPMPYRQMMLFSVCRRYGIQLRYHLPFTAGTVEHTLHRRPLWERLHLIHQLGDIILTAKEKQQVQANMNPIRSDFMIHNQGHEVMHTPANMQHSI
jgi:hypothetical protein